MYTKNFSKAAEDRRAANERTDKGVLTSGWFPFHYPYTTSKRIVTAKTKNKKESIGGFKNDRQLL